MKRYFQYVGSPTLTRRDYGMTLRGGHTAMDDDGAIAVFDPDCGEMTIISIDAGIESGDWIEISAEQHSDL